MTTTLLVASLLTLAFPPAAGAHANAGMCRRCFPFWLPEMHALSSTLCAILLVGAALLQPNMLAAAQVPVRHKEGLMHGFLALRTLEGKKIADGEMTQVAHGDRVTDHLIFRFNDGSVHEATTIFTEPERFRLLSDHLVERGPPFKQPMETSIDCYRASRGPLHRARWQRKSLDPNS
jgi:hypothetical protein